MDLPRLVEEVREPLKKSASVKKHLTLVQNWQNYHNIMASKNNH